MVVACRAVFGHVPPLLVGQVAERLVDGTQVLFELVHAVELLAHARVAAEAIQRGTLQARAEVVQHQPAHGCAAARGELGADVAAERGSDPVHFRDVEPAQQRRHRGQVGFGDIVMRARQAFAASATRQIGRDHPHAALCQVPRQEIEVAPVAREAVQADHGPLGVTGAPFRVVQPDESERAQQWIRMKARYQVFLLQQFDHEPLFPKL